MYIKEQCTRNATKVSNKCILNYTFIQVYLYDIFTVYETSLFPQDMYINIGI